MVRCLVFVGLWCGLGWWGQPDYTICSICGTDRHTWNWKHTVFHCLRTDDTVWIQVCSRLHHWPNRCILCIWYSIPQGYQWDSIVLSAQCVWHDRCPAFSSMHFETSQQLEQASKCSCVVCHFLRCIYLDKLPNSLVSITFSVVYLDCFSLLCIISWSVSV